MQGPVRGAAVLSAARRAGRAPRDAAVEASRGSAQGAAGFPDLGRREIAVLTPLIVLILVLGFFPGPVLDVINPSVTATMNEVGLPDPVGGATR